MKNKNILLFALAFLIASIALSMTFPYGQRLEAVKYVFEALKYVLGVALPLMLITTLAGSISPPPDGKKKLNKLPDAENIEELKEHSEVSEKKDEVPESNAPARTEISTVSVAPDGVNNFPSESNVENAADEMSMITPEIHDRLLNLPKPSSAKKQIYEEPSSSATHKTEKDRKAKKSSTGHRCVGY